MQKDDNNNRRMDFRWNIGFIESFKIMESNKETCCASNETPNETLYTGIK